MTVNEIRYTFLEHNLYTKEECAEILKYKTNVSRTKYSVKLEKDFQEKGGYMMSQDLIPNPDNQWVFDRMKNYVESKYPVKWLEDPHGVFRQYSEGDFFVEHTDHVEWKIGTKKHVRLFAISIQLTPEHNFEGGELILDRKIEANKTLGSIALFGSHVIHEVKPITKGSRNSLIFFVSSKHIKFTNTVLI
jgi:hypothetical protein